jgi:glycosyltransferase involved in cell wall biosynthesis
MYNQDSSKVVIAFIGSAGIPNRYGGFEAFLEHTVGKFSSLVARVLVTCDSRLYQERYQLFNGAERIFISVPANGRWSIVHDLLAFLSVFKSATHIVVLGVSGAIWFPFFRLLCQFANKKIIVNVDGLEWRRSKYSKTTRFLLRAFDAVAQTFANVIVYDNMALEKFVVRKFQKKGVCIGYSGDHVLRSSCSKMGGFSALTICRIEPENNISMMIEGVLLSEIDCYTIVGNWKHSDYGRQLRSIYKANPRLKMLDPIYDRNELANLRESCDVYIHGHSVGGTNPSLVEMVFYDCAILCYDVSFNRETIGDCAEYFTCAKDLAQVCRKSLAARGNRSLLRSKYTADNIAAQYLKIMI